jgi:uncharacterized DUF497 family protein
MVKYMYNKCTTFEWDAGKNAENLAKHGVSFEVAQAAFLDKRRVVLSDFQHSEEEQRYFCIGRIGEGIITVRFTIRGNAIRIFGAGFWRKGRKLYEEQN